jgi:hypothetical protein
MDDFHDPKGRRVRSRQAKHPEKKPQSGFLDTEMKVLTSLLPSRHAPSQ